MMLFQPGKIGSMKVKNRIVMPPMAVSGQSESDGRFSPRGIEYFVARARGGVGLIITGGTHVETTLEPEFAQVMPVANSPIHIARLAELCEKVQHYGGRVAIQLLAGPGRQTFAGLTQSRPVGPSEVPCVWLPGVTTRELTREEIQMLIRSFGIAAGICKAAGVDAVEVHGYGGYLHDQFLTPLWNKRTDEYGGDIDGRMRFSREVISAIRGAAGEDYPIIFRYTPVHFIEGGREMEGEGLEIAKRLEIAGVDALHVSVGCHETWYRSIQPIYEAPGCSVQYAEQLKKVLKVPVIVDGKLGDPYLAEKVLHEGKVDFIGLGRSLLADSEWPEKVRQGKLDDIRPCIGDLEGCLGRLCEGKTVSCTVNATTGMEKDYAIPPVVRRKSVLVIGGGPAGLEAARVAALRGHEVALWEKSTKLGGNLIPASIPGFKQDIRPLIDYLSTQVQKLGVKIRFMEKATPELVLENNPEVVIVATGATPLIPELPGIGGDNVFSAVDLLWGKKEARKTVIVAGGGIVGCETAVYLAQKGKKVTIIEMRGQLLPEENVYSIPRMRLLNMVEENHVNVFTSTQLLEVTGEAAVVRTDGSERRLEANSVVLALGFQPESALQDALEGRVPELFAIGDCVRPRRILNAMWEGFHTARLL